MAFAENRPISDTCEFSRNLHKQSQKQLEIHLQACRRHFREFGAISGTYQNPPCSGKSMGYRPFAENRPGPLLFPKAVENLQAFSRPGSLERFLALTKIPLLRILKIGQFRTLANRNAHKQSQKQLEIHLQAFSRRFREFGAISGTYQNPPCSKAWAMAQAFS